LDRCLSRLDRAVEHIPQARAGWFQDGNLMTPRASDLPDWIRADQSSSFSAMAPSSVRTVKARLVPIGLTPMRSKAGR
jgi:hypothetical protein